MARSIQTLDVPKAQVCGLVRLLFCLSVCLVVRLSAEAIAKEADAKTDNRQADEQTR